MRTGNIIDYKYTIPQKNNVRKCFLKKILKIFKKFFRPQNPVNKGFCADFLCVLEKFLFWQ